MIYIHRWTVTLEDGVLSWRVVCEVIKYNCVHLSENACFAGNMMMERFGLWKWLKMTEIIKLNFPCVPGQCDRNEWKNYKARVRWLDFVFKWNHIFKVLHLTLIWNSGIWDINLSQFEACCWAVPSTEWYEANCFSNGTGSPSVSKIGFNIGEKHSRSW